MGVLHAAYGQGEDFEHTERIANSQKALERFPHRWSPRSSPR